MHSGDGYGLFQRLAIPPEVERGESVHDALRGIQHFDHTVRHLALRPFLDYRAAHSERPGRELQREWRLRVHEVPPDSTAVIPARESAPDTRAASSSIVVASLMAVTRLYRFGEGDVVRESTSVARIAGEHQAPTETRSAARAPADCVGSRCRSALGRSTDLRGRPPTPVSEVASAPGFAQARAQMRFGGHRPRRTPGGTEARAPLRHYRRLPRALTDIQCRPLGLQSRLIREAAQGLRANT